MGSSANISQQSNLAYQGLVMNEGKRKRRPTTFAGFLTSERQLDNLLTGESASLDDATGTQEVADLQDTSATPSAYDSAVPVGTSVPETKLSMSRRSRTKVEVKGEHGSSPRQQTRSGSSTSNPVVKKVIGVQNATRKALEWLQYEDLTLTQLAGGLPKLSRARVEVVMEALRAAGLVTLVRKHAPDVSGEDHVTEVYRFSAGRSAEEALEIGGGKAVALGTMSKRIKASEAQLASLKERIKVLKVEAARDDLQPQQLLYMLKDFVKQDKTLDDDPFYIQALKATSAAAGKTESAEANAEVLRAEKLAARKKAENAAAAAAAVAAKKSSSLENISTGAVGLTVTNPFSEATTSQTLPRTFSEVTTSAGAQRSHPDAVVSVTAATGTTTPFIGELGGVVMGVHPRSEKNK